MKLSTPVLLIIFAIVFAIGAVLGYRANTAISGDSLKRMNPFPASCEYNGKSYKSGEHFRSSDSCNSCGCENGQVACTLMACATSSN